jgi:anti-sigma B factor antagonist
MSALTATVRAEGPAAVLELVGELDYNSAPLARESVRELALRTGQLFVVDLGGVSFCDSSGISALFAARNHALAAGARIALAAVPAQIARVFKIIGLDDVFATHATTADALAAPPAG